MRHIASRLNGNKSPTATGPSDWRKTLWILWAANFSVTAGMSLIIPFLPYYIEFLGVHDLQDVEVWSGWVFSAQFVTSFLFQPLWGSLSDKYGRKAMLLRAGFGMAIVTGAMGLVTSPWQLLALRMINGVFSGFISMGIALLAVITPNEHAGKALGTLQTGGIAGSLIGPLIGGILAEALGYNRIFFLTGILLLIASLIVLVYIKEPKSLRRKSVTKEKMDWQAMTHLIPIFIASFVTQLGMMSIEPIVTIYAKTLYSGLHLEFIAGLVVAITGMANLFGAPTLGKLSDKIGQRRTLLLAFVMAAAAFLPQALAGNITVLLVGRFLLGLFVGGMIPSLNALVKKLSPPNKQGTAYGFNTSAMFLGNLVGPLVGSHAAALFGIRSVFYITMSILLLNAVTIYFNRNLDSVPSNL
ncbi:MAG TPA: MFS transporter [Bacilli bacterium]